jgi:hypothetical protein
MESSHNIRTDLDLAYQLVRDLPEDIATQNRYHTVLLRTTFYIPCLESVEEGEDYIPLRLYHDDKAYCVAFDHPERLLDWSKDVRGQEKVIGVKKLIGEELISALSPHVYLLINIGTSYYFELFPEHINYLKTVITNVHEQLPSGF